jgi:uncharacterized protein YfaP (DUF2135 family)
MHVYFRSDHNHIDQSREVRSHLAQTLRRFRDLPRHIKQLTLRLREGVGWGEPAGDCAIDAITRDGQHVHLRTPGTRVMSAIDHSLLALHKQVVKPTASP